MPAESKRTAVLTGANRVKGADIGGDHSRRRLDLPVVNASIWLRWLRPTAECSGRG